MRHRMAKRKPSHKRKRKHHVKAAKPRRHRLHLPPKRSRPTGPPTPQTLLTEPMVDRLFWRAGFGPTALDRATWTGKPLSAAVNWLLSTPAGLFGPPATNGGAPLDPTGNDTDLVLSWVDRMVRSTNPFVELLTFFWHRHWANSRDQVSPPQLLMTQNGLFRHYSDFGSNPKATFRQMAYDVTVDPSMLRYLTGESNVKGARRHRLHLPPVELPRALTVDEKEWAVRPSKTLVGTGVVRFTAYNRGEDNHNFVIVGPAGNTVGQAALLPGTAATVTASLRPGTYQLFCSLFAGTPESHYARGMHATITVR